MVRAVLQSFKTSSRSLSVSAPSTEISAPLWLLVP